MYTESICGIKKVYFSDRMSLGDKLADSMPTLYGRDAILVCLKPSSMMVAVAMAVKLRAWVLPLFYEDITNPLDPTSKIGALTQSGEFCLNPALTQNDYQYVVQEFMGKLEEEKREALSRLNTKVNSYYGSSDPHILNNRPVVLVGDVVFNALSLEVAKNLLKPLTPSAVYGVAGNATIDVSTEFRLATNDSVILDVLPSSVLGEDHYFENHDAYSEQEKQALAINIAQYWA